MSNTYARQMDEFGELLDNSAELSETVVDKESELEDFFDEGDQFADVLREFLDASGDDIIATAANSVQPLEVGAEYSTMFPCWFKGENALINTVVNEVFGNNTLHIAIPIANPQPSRYGLAGRPGTRTADHPDRGNARIDRLFSARDPRLQAKPGRPGQSLPRWLGHRL